MDNYQETFDTWNKVADIYQDKYMHMDLYNETYNFICDSITTPHANLLEVGCGPGNITKYLLSKRPDFNIHAIDIAPNMIALAQKNNPTATCSVMDSRKIHELTTTFDGIICGFSLPYLSESDSEKFIADASGLLNSDGLIYISFVEGEPEQSCFHTASTGERVFFHYYNLNRLQILLANNGFEHIQVFKVQFERSATVTETHTVLTARKKQS